MCVIGFKITICLLQNAVILPLLLAIFEMSKVLCFSIKILCGRGITAQVSCQNNCMMFIYIILVKLTTSIDVQVTVHCDIFL